jgi:hypothetical protein
VRGIEAWIEKHNKYSTYNTRIYANVMQGTTRGDLEPRLLGNSAERKRFIKHYIWPHLPGRAPLFFLYMYFFRLGFLDGLHGFQFCVMHAVFQQFVVVKQWEQKQRNKGAPENVIRAQKTPTPAIVRTQCNRNDQSTDTSCASNSM